MTFPAAVATLRIIAGGLLCWLTAASLGQSNRGALVKMAQSTFVVIHVDLEEIILEFIARTVSYFAL